MTPSPGTLTFAVPAACRDSARNLREATRLLDDAIGSVRDFDPDDLIDVLDRLQTLDEETRPLVNECSQADASATVVPGDSPTATATASGTG